MFSSKTIIVTSVLVVLMISAVMARQSVSLPEQIKRFAPTALRGDISDLSDADKKALSKLNEAARILDKLYLRQVWSGNEKLREKLTADKTPAGKERLHYFDINMGPWSIIDGDKVFIDGAPAQKPDGANVYPGDMTKIEFNDWLKSLPESERKQATGFFYVIRRDSKGTLKTVPYSEEYGDLLKPAAALLMEAAALTTNSSLKKFLVERADAFVSNDYYQSDLAWMDLDSPIEPTIGPYEVYLDNLFNYKAAFEAYITVRNDAETKKLALYSDHLQEIENDLPIDPKYRNPHLGALSPICVVDEVMIGGEARAGVQTAAFNLPNDERITREKGSKRVMLKNVQEAKFRRVLLPIAQRVLDPDQSPDIAFEPFFTHILAHELMHGLGPHTITVNGRQTTVRQEMKELNSALEEAKADISGLFALQYLMDHEIIDRSMERSMYITYLAGTFRSVRFGIDDAHGKGMALQFNFLSDEGAIAYNKDKGTFRMDLGKIKAALTKLTGILMTLQAEGNYDGVKSLFDTYATIRPTMKSVLAKLDGIPVDIEPTFEDSITKDR